MGSIFKFVTTDITDKLHILNNYLNGNDYENFVNLESFIKFEIYHGRVDFKTRNDSACRTFLRLHRALLFVSEFLKELQNLEDSSSLSDMTWKVYEKTLGVYHNWAIKKLVGVALYTLPTKKQLTSKMLKSGLNEEELKSCNEDLTTTLGNLYVRCQEVLEKNNLLNLP